jgi:dTDP-glucose pyrophosphorylase
MVFNKHIIYNEESLKTGLIRLDELAYDAILFTVNENGNLTGSVTDGDIRRGLVKGITIDQPLHEVSFKTPRTLSINNIDIHTLIKLRESQIGIIPIVDNNNKIVDVINFRLRKSLLPVDVVIMAGGKGMRLRPLTEKNPKPLLKIGDKPILEHSLRSYEQYGVKSIHITTNYLAEKINSFVDSIKEDFRTPIKTIKEDKFLGTIGAVRLVKEINQDYVLISNSDLLTNLDYEAFFVDFIQNDAEMSVVSIPYRIKIPYAIMDIKENYIESFQEKPNYTYFSNGGIYLIKKELIQKIPPNEPFSATDLMQLMLSEKRKIRTFAHKGYWLDIGQHEDYSKAQEDFKRNQF